MTTRLHLARAVALLAAVVVLNFILPRLLPGSPLSGGAALDTAVLPAGAAGEMRRMYGLDLPWPEQFARYLRTLLRADLGRSLATHRPVVDLIMERLPWTLLLSGSAVLISVLLGGLLATAAVWSAHRRGARAAGGAIVVAGALPEFLVAMLLILGLATVWPVFPSGGARSPFLTAAGPTGWIVIARDVFWHATLPGLTLVIALLPAFFLLSRSALAAVAGERFLLVARGKGLTARRVLWHAWRNALPAVLTLLGLRLAFAVTGAALVERIFAYPGMGMLLFEAVGRRDYPVMQGVFLTASLAVIAVTLLTDLLASLLDPRIREGAA